MIGMRRSTYMIVLPFLALRFLRFLCSFLLSHNYFLLSCFPDSFFCKDGSGLLQPEPLHHSLLFSVYVLAICDDAIASATFFTRPKAKSSSNSPRLMFTSDLAAIELNVTVRTSAAVYNTTVLPVL